MKHRTNRPHRLFIVCMFAAALVGAVAGAALVGSARAEDPAPDSSAAAPAAPATRIYELRTYTTPPGKLADLHARFRDHTNALFVKHGMEPIAYWTPAEGPEAENTLIYVLAHASRDAARKSWAAFGVDPEWRKARTESEVNGPLTAKVESVFMNPTDYSKLQ